MSGIIKKKLLLLTFDYELFLGDKSGSVEACLIKPTDHLIKILHRYNTKAIFFVDTTYLIRLKEVANKYECAEKDFESIKNQIVNLIVTGHSVFPHIHPHWFDAKYDEQTNEWSLKDFTKYRFSSINNEQRTFLFEESINILNDIIRPVKPDYKIDSYRAGGWSIQPFNNFKPYFEKYGIVNDFSVIPGKYNVSTAHVFDFRNAPVKNIYRFNEDITTEFENGSFKEFTISSITLSKLMVWFNFKIRGLLKRLKIKPYGNGTTVNSSVIEEEDIQSVNGKRLVASFEGLTFITLSKYITAIKKSNYFQFISHPKLLTRHELWLLNILLSKLKKMDIETDLKKLPAITND